jgi:phage tail sheath protein FI
MRSGVRFLDFSRDVNTANLSRVKDYLKFTVPLQGGFDGVNMFAAEKKHFSNVAAYFELNDSAQGKKKGQVTGAYLKALEMLQDKTEVDIKLLAVPGIRVEAITNAALSVAEERFDTFYVMDIEEVDANLGTVVTSSNQTISPSLTAERFRSRAMNSTFAATYFPDVETQNIARGPATVFVPPSVAALRVYSRLNSEGNVAAPAGAVRGVISPEAGGAAFQSKVQFDDTQKSTIKELYDVAINPIISNENGLILFGQRTMFTSAESMLQRVSIRRMVIDIRRAVKQAAQFVIFEQNTEKVLSDFQANLQPILSRFVRAGGISKYRVVVDETTTTQADIEANVVRGKVFLQPTRSEEIVQVDFVT